MRGLRRIVALVGALLLFVASGCGDDDPPRDDDGAIVEEGDLGMQSVQVGDCFDDPSELAGQESIEVEAVGAVPCDQPHDNEVYHLFDLPDGDYPGDEQIESLAAEGCVGSFEEFIGVPYEESALGIFPITPTAATWDTFDDREVICAVYLPQEQLTGTARGSAR